MWPENFNVMNDFSLWFHFENDLQDFITWEKHAYRNLWFASISFIISVCVFFSFVEFANGNYRRLDNNLHKCFSVEKFMWHSMYVLEVILKKNDSILQSFWKLLLDWLPACKP